MAIQYVKFPLELRNLLDRIFSEDFMREHTSFDSFEAFQFSSAVFLDWSKDCLVYNDAVFDAFVRESTCFSNWEEMVCTGTDLYFSELRKQKT